jgi:hypothetical protein
MLIALLAVLGVNLIVVAGLLVVVLGRRRWVNHRPGVFPGAIRVSAGEHDGFGPKRRRGYGRWVRDVFVWTKKPFLFRNELVAVDGLQAIRAAHDGEIRRMGGSPAVVELVADGAVIQIAVHGKDQALALGPYRDRAASAAVGDTALEIPVNPVGAGQGTLAAGVPATSGSDEQPHHG